MEQGADGFPNALRGSLLGFSRQLFELCEDLLDRIEVGRILRQEEAPRAAGANGFGDRRALVGAQIVHDNDVAWFQGRRQNLLDIGEETLAVDRPIEHEGRRNLVASQRGEEGHGFPMPMRRLGDQRRSAFVPAVRARHIGLGPGLVDEDKAFWIEPRLNFLPQGATTRDIRAILLGGEQRFFLKLIFSRRRNRHKVSQETTMPRARSSKSSACKVRSGFSLKRARRKPR